MKTMAMGALVLGFVAGCNAPEAQVPDGARAVAAIHTAKCGNCHVPPEPKSRTRAHLEDAFTRHRTRVHLSDEQWAAMIDYLAGPEGATAQRN
jgi:hypothetical protein